MFYIRFLQLDDFIGNFPTKEAVEQHLQSEGWRRSIGRYNGWEHPYVIIPSRDIAPPHSYLEAVVEEGDVEEARSRREANFLAAVAWKQRLQRWTESNLSSALGAGIGL